MNYVRTSVRNWSLVTHLSAVHGVTNEAYRPPTMWQ